MNINLSFGGIKKVILLSVPPRHMRELFLKDFEVETLLCFQFRMQHAG